MGVDNSLTEFTHSIDKIIIEFVFVFKSVIIFMLYKLVN